MTDAEKVEESKRAASMVSLYLHSEIQSMIEKHPDFHGELAIKITLVNGLATRFVASSEQSHLIDRGKS